jgi:hypothetical protein
MKIIQSRTEEISFHDSRAMFNFSFKDAHYSNGARALSCSWFGSSSPPSSYPAYPARIEAAYRHLTLFIPLTELVLVPCCFHCVHHLDHPIIATRSKVSEMSANHHLVTHSMHDFKIYISNIRLSSNEE